MAAGVHAGRSEVGGLPDCGAVMAFSMPLRLRPRSVRQRRVEQSIGTADGRCDGVLAGVQVGAVRGAERGWSVLVSARESHCELAFSLFSACAAL